VNFSFFELLCKTWCERKFNKLDFSVLKGKRYQKTLGNGLGLKAIKENNFLDPDLKGWKFRAISLRMLP
jgi:hypothetical protein